MEPAGRVTTRPTAEGGLALWFTLAFAAGGLVIGDDHVFLVGCVLLGCVLAAWPLSRRNLAGLELTRSLPPRVRVGTPAHVPHEVHGRARAARLGIDLDGRADGASPGSAVRLSFAAIPARGRATLTPQLTFSRRGWHMAAPPTVSSRHPLGLFRSSRRIGEPVRVLVRPREGRVTRRLLALLSSESPRLSARSASASGDDVLHGLREHREGDDPRRIHWRTTARRGTLTVTQWRAETGRRVVLVLGRGVGPGGGAAFERAVSVAATVWRALHRADVPATLVLGAGAPLAGGRRGLDAGLDALASVRSQRGRKPLAALAAVRGAHPSPIVLFVAARPEADLAARLSRVASSRGARHVLPCHEASIASWVRGLP
jgi:uncharacterized protein (DUF58 family)